MYNWNKNSPNSHHRSDSPESGDEKFDLPFDEAQVHSPLISLSTLALLPRSQASDRLHWLNRMREGRHNKEYVRMLEIYVHKTVPSLEGNEGWNCRLKVYNTCERYILYINIPNLGDVRGRRGTA
ncbi:hypothetical protein DFP72DRAFT_844334 [Ephemerocybe angulata]|uniref:Uncharacterized protein n=1 Tax=Ephemerocybe angulata TaxID=980116 RepID=A0A8H6M983_9AGAR|nr:hypothetical protein DFP72DRAFT_844332 [Tulosesus angulatus]KAF6759650.1 hypothetical protein DFP72DRAFT_844334 [Tulosesus angulatus]